MKIHSEQIEAFSRKRRAEFLQKAKAYLGGIKPDWGVVDSAFLDTFVDRTLDQAATLAITQEKDVIRYMELLLRMGPARWKSPSFAWTGEYLGERRPAEERLDLIVERLRFDGGMPE
jgi:hypothetical protein